MKRHAEIIKSLKAIDNTLNSIGWVMLVTCVFSWFFMFMALVYLCQ